MGVENAVGLGFFLPSDWCPLGGAGSFGTAGFGGSRAWANPELQLAFAYTPNLCSLGHFDAREAVLSRTAVACAMSASTLQEAIRNFHVSIGNNEYGTCYRPLESSRAHGQHHGRQWHFGAAVQGGSTYGKTAPIALLMAGVGIAVIAGCLAEVASRFRESGGPYLYTKVAFGRLVGLQTGWLNWLSRLASSAANANLLPDYLAEFWPRLREPLPRVTKSEAREELQKEIAR